MVKTTTKFLTQFIGFVNTSKLWLPETQQNILIWSYSHTMQSLFRQSGSLFVRPPIRSTTLPTFNNSTPFLPFGTPVEPMKVPTLKSEVIEILTMNKKAKKVHINKMLVLKCLFICWKVRKKHAKKAGKQVNMQR